MYVVILEGGWESSFPQAPVNMELEAWSAYCWSVIFHIPVCVTVTGHRARGNFRAPRGAK